MLATDAQRRELESLFNVCTAGALDDPFNQVEFAGMGVVYIPAQSNDPACTTSLCNIEKICSSLTSSKQTTDLDKLVELSKAQNGGGCVFVSYSSVVKAYTPTSSTARE